MLSLVDPPQIWDSVLQVCVDLALAIQMASIAESMAFGVSLGLEAKTLAGILNASSSRCWSSTNYNPVLCELTIHI